MFPGSAINSTCRKRCLSLPKRPKTSSMASIVYMNYCTVSYSAAWWDWERWQARAGLYGNELHQHAFVCCRSGSRVVQHAAGNIVSRMKRHGISGPRMPPGNGCKTCWDYGGPLPKSWIDSHIRLGKQILTA